jgi:hypothetical protein
MNPDLFVSPPIALLCQEHNFPEKCFAWYNYGSLEFFGRDLMLDMYAGEENHPHAPLYAQVQAWLRDTHLIHIKESPSSNGTQFSSWTWYLMLNEQKSRTGNHIKYKNLPNSITYKFGMDVAIEEAFKILKDRVII